MSRQINNLKQEMMEQLNQEGQELLEEIYDTYIRQGNALLRDAFVDGLCTAIELVMDFHQKRTT